MNKEALKHLQQQGAEAGAQACALVDKAGLSYEFEVVYGQPAEVLTRIATEQGCSGIVIRDPYIRAFHQVRNLVEFLRMVNEITPVGDEVTVHLITGSDQETLEKQVENLGQVQDSFAGTSTPFTWELDASTNFHARSITTDHGWKITLDRGLDLFQWFEFSPFNAAAVMQEARMVKGCEVNYIQTGP
jgi:ATP-dependent Lon protease